MNNKYYHKKCPSLMNNNRIFTSYILNNELNKNFCNILNCTDEHNYRKKLQDNGTFIINKLNEDFNKHYSCKF